jgi:hypothetical protein
MKEKIKEIITEGWDVFPKWLLIANFALIAISLLVIIFV